MKYFLIILAIIIVIYIIIKVLDKNKGKADVTLSPSIIPPIIGTNTSGNTTLIEGEFLSVDAISRKYCPEGYILSKGHCVYLGFSEV